MALQNGKIKEEADFFLFDDGSELEGDNEELSFDEIYDDDEMQLYLDFSKRRDNQN